MDSDLKEERMRKAYLALLTGFIMSGCSGNMDNSSTGSSDSARINSGERAKQEVQFMVSPAGEGSTAPASIAFSRYSAIMRGMSEKDMTELVKDVTLESGTVYGGGNSRRLYYRIGPNTQFWVEVEGDMNPVVTGKGPLEAKQEWKRYENNVIEIGGPAR